MVEREYRDSLIDIEKLLKKFNVINIIEDISNNFLFRLTECHYLPCNYFPASYPVIPNVKFILL